MKLFTTIALALGLVANAVAGPLEARAAQVVHLVFHGGPAQYPLTLYADGTVYPTHNSISVDTIDALDFAAYSQCTFYSAGQKTLVSSIDSAGNAHIFVGPPQPITGVSCTGTCVPTYSDCYRDGQYVGSCCNGFCAANKCRPWVIPSA